MNQERLSRLVDTQIHISLLSKSNESGGSWRLAKLFIRFPMILVDYYASGTGIGSLAAGEVGADSHTYAIVVAWLQ